MATHSSIFAWKMPWTEEPGRLQFMGSHKDRRQQVPWEPRRPPAPWVGKDPLEKEMAIHSTLAWRATVRGMAKSRKK